MAKKRTRVALPGGIQGLVKDLQNNTSTYAPRPIVDQDEIELEEHSEAAENAASAVVDDRKAPVAVAEERVPTNKEDVKPTSEPMANVAAEASVAGENAVEERNGSDPKSKENMMREYRIVKDNSQDSWDLFIDMARQYKSGGGKLATIYIDETLKSVLDRMKYAGPDKLSTSAILSSIVARFIYDHEEEIRKTLFSGNLI